MAFIHFNLEFYEETKPISLDVLFVVGCVETEQEDWKYYYLEISQFFLRKAR